MSEMRIIGLTTPLLSEQLRGLLTTCRLLVAAKRFFPLATELGIPFFAISPLNTAIEAVHRHLPQGDIAVLVGGDPLFFGIGRTLLAEFPEHPLHFYPATTALQRACARFRLPWDDAVVSSLHGRRHHHLPGLLLRHAKNLLFTDAVNSPNRVATSLLDYLQLIEENTLAANIEVRVAEDLDLESERVFCGSLAETATRQFSPLNVVALLVPGQCPVPYRFGLGEEQLRHSRGLITKNEVRAATLHTLQLPQDGVLWDIGAGSGSVSIEAARQNGGLTVYAIEQNDRELANIKENIRKYRCYNIIPVQGRAPDSCLALPDPQRVFIGGSGGNLAAILAMAASRLTPNGLVVVNGVVAATIGAAPKLMQDHGMQVVMSTLQVSRRDAGGNLTTFNPITIITGRK
jgi:precorrin-6B C5,15-methyltransferase / cobalt-precorrin-6B C5,C15-methyltransferase